MDENEYIKVANQSGFPLQIAVADLVRQRTDLGWSVYCVEHAWKSPSDDSISGFIDLVIEKWNSFLVIECKRVRDAAWVFLLPDSGQRARRFARSWITAEASLGAYNYFGWYPVSLTPVSAESAFCAVRGQDAHSRTLEKVAAELVTATEAFALQHAKVRERPGSQPICRYYFNVIVTTAKIAVCDFVPIDLNISDGTIVKSDVTLVPYLRFRKQFSASPLGAKREPTYSPYGEENENTVFIVNSDHLGTFLQEFEISVEALDKYR